MLACEARLSRAFLTNAMKKLLLALMGTMIGAAATPQTDAGSEALNVAYCIGAIERFAAADRALMARAGDNASLRDAAADSLAQYERSLGRLRERFAALPDKDGRAMAAATRDAHTDQAAFLGHYEVCWNYCSPQDVGSPPWQACIARCRKADPVISRLDRCRTLD